MSHTVNFDPDAVIAWARAEKTRHQAAIADLDATIRAAEVAKATAVTVDLNPPPRALVFGKAPKKRALLSVIADSGVGLSTAAAIREATARGVADLRVGNVSPKLSAAGKAGLLSLDGGIWTITQKGREYLAATQD